MSDEKSFQYVEMLPLFRAVVNIEIRNTRGLTSDGGRSLSRFLIVAVLRQKIENMRCYTLLSLQLSRMVL